MRITLENILYILSLVLAEAWFLDGYFSGKVEYEPLIVFLTLLAAIFTKDMIKAKLGFGGESNNHDSVLFEEFLRIFPINPTLFLLKEKDFGDSFPREDLQPLYKFVDTWNSVDKEFLNKKLEKERRSLYSAAEDLASEFAKRTVPIGEGDYISVFPDNLRGGLRPDHVIEDAKVLNQKAREFTPKYESFIRICKRAV